MARRTPKATSTHPVNRSRARFTGGRRSRPPARLTSKMTPPFSRGSLPGAFHVHLDRPASVDAFRRALCGSRQTSACPGGLVLLEHARKPGGTAQPGTGAGSVRVRP